MSDLLFKTWLAGQSESTQAILKHQDRTLLNELLESAFLIGQRDGIRVAHEAAIRGIDKAFDKGPTL